MADWVKEMCCWSDSFLKRQHAKSREIDKAIAKERIKLRRTVKILLLGSGESGKSTFLKQMRIIHGSGFSESERLSFKPIIYSNILKGMKVLVDARDKLKIDWGDPENSIHADHVFRYDNCTLDPSSFSSYTTAIAALWTDKGILTAFDRRRYFQLGDSVCYFLDNLERIGSSTFIPTQNDILHARKATKGILSHEMYINCVPFVFVDVGGQRTQRQKWLQCFENVTSILFIASSSEFDQVLHEDRRSNRLLESCIVFETIVNHMAFVEISIILFLNKTDLLEKKVKTVSIKDYFPTFKGDPQKLEDVQNFQLSLFDSRKRDSSRHLFHHYTTAISTNNIKIVFKDVKETILHDNIKQLMLH